MQLGDSLSEAHNNNKIEKTLHLLKELPNLDDDTLQSLGKEGQDTSVKILDSGETTETGKIPQNSRIPHRSSRLKKKDKRSTQDQPKPALENPPPSIRRSSRHKTNVNRLTYW